MSKEREETLLRRILWGGVFIIGVGVILLADLPWESILILFGLVVLAEGVMRYYFESLEGKTVEEKEKK